MLTLMVLTNDVCSCCKNDSAGSSIDLSIEAFLIDDFLFQMILLTDFNTCILISVTHSSQKSFKLWVSAIFTKPSTVTKP